MFPKPLPGCLRGKVPQVLVRHRIASAVRLQGVHIHFHLLLLHWEAIAVSEATLAQLPALFSGAHLQQGPVDVLLNASAVIG